MAALTVPEAYVAAFVIDVAPATERALVTKGEFVDAAPSGSMDEDVVLTLRMSPVEIVICILAAFVDLDASLM